MANPPSTSSSSRSWFSSISSSRSLVFIIVVVVLAVLVSSASSTAGAGGSNSDEALLKVPILEAGVVWYHGLGARLSNFVSNGGFLAYLPHYTSPWFYVIVGILLVIGYYLYDFLFVPMNRIRLLGDVGYIPESKYSMREVANMVRKRRMAGEVPPVYPNGWFAVLESRDLKNGDSKYVSCLGK